MIEGVGLLALVIILSALVPVALCLITYFFIRLFGGRLIR